jgi:ribosomal-protein-alanine N-acetyltransferase
MVEHPEIRLLAATPEQAGALSALHVQLFEKGWDADGMRRLLEHPACVALVATTRHAPGLIGFIIAQLTADEAEILSIGVDKAWQKQGVGCLLVEALIGLAKRKEARRLFLDVAESNQAALALYARLGFTRMGQRKDYYLHADGQREDALLMVRQIQG